MTSFLSAAAVAIIVAFGAVYVLDSMPQQRADQAYASTTGARIPDHGTTSNLVGTDWYSSRKQ